MDIQSLSFIYLFLPMALLLCWITPVRQRGSTLLALSVFFYVLLEGMGVLLLASLIASDLVMAYLVHKALDFPVLRKVIASCSVFKSVAVVAAYGIWSQITGESVPLGLGICALTSMGYVLDCYYGWAQADANPFHAALMIGFFPKLYAGPLVTWGRMAHSLHMPRVSLDKVGKGGWIFVRGLSKRVILGEPLGALFIRLHDVPLYDTSVLTTWVMVITLALLLYYLLSGYCDMASGLALMFGMELPDNFNFPFSAGSINAFFARFNMTLSRYLRRYLYVRLGGAQGKFVPVSANILLFCVLMGLWYGFRWNLVLWGAFLALFVIAERYVPQRIQKAAPPLIAWLYCMFVIVVSFAFFAGDTPQQSFGILRVMMGAGGVPAISKDILYQLASNYLILILSVLLATGLFGKLAAWVQKRLPNLYELGRMLGGALLLLWCSMAML